jgi:hypothetical protein
MRYIKLLILGIGVMMGIEASDAQDPESFEFEMRLKNGEEEDPITKYVNENGDYVNNGKPVTKAVLAFQNEVDDFKQKKVSILNYQDLTEIINQLTQFYIVYLISKDNTLQPIVDKENRVDLYREAFANKNTLVTITSDKAKLLFIFSYPFKKDDTDKQNSQYKISALEYIDIDHTNIKKFILLLATFLSKLDLMLSPNLQQQILNQIQQEGIVSL